MLKPLKDFNVHDASELCIHRQNEFGKHKCVGCPASMAYGNTNTVLCYFIAVMSVNKYGKVQVDDGSIDEKDLPWWNRN